MSRFTEMSAEEAAAMVKDGDVIGFSGFTPAGAAKAIPTAIAAMAKSEHEAGRPFKIGVITGASTGASLDGALAEADAISFRTPYQSNPTLRKSINAGKVQFFDMHLSMLPQAVRYGNFGKLAFAIVEACEVTNSGEIVLSTSVGASPTFLQHADKILIELNSKQSRELRGIHDIYEPFDPPYRRALPVYSVRDRAGAPVVKVDPSKIVGIVHTELDDEVGGFTPPDDVTNQIGENVATFLANEIRSGLIPKEFLPLQSGVGNIANAVLGALGANPDIPAFEMYSEVIQDSVIDLMKNDRIRFASGTSITVTNDVLKEIYENMDFFRPRMILRPQEISNNPEIVRRIGIVSINTAIEVDIFGNVNSTHIMGASMMNGIGGSGDFTRNAYTSIFTCPSTAKGGVISAIVPQVSHMDHSEHSVNVIVTEQGVADLRGKSPNQRAKAIIDNCAHPDYKAALTNYARLSSGHTAGALDRAYAMHVEFLKSGSMQSIRYREGAGMADAD